MKDQLVAFETAKLAKEKGFNGKCHYHFISDSYMEEYYNPYIKFQYDISSEMNHLMPLSNTDFKVFLDNNLSGKTYVWTKAISAPTQSLLQKWLREVHSIHILLNVGMYDGVKQTFYCNVCLFGKNRYKSVFRSQTSIYTYEQALEKGLSEALKLINTPK